ncbi:AAA family ATPase [Sphingobium yanoikuyae]|uniref:AAA family ATPase n=1 Tax=Sphingobium yanoikuyae TaxID=13690 RepID=A0A6P1GBL8_SPHYA|nr:AAA family ATPase [Sphingobium yanoikuyae]QHD65748.1 AAA family ATPase [Sphingobium yanoikuyae]
MKERFESASPSSLVQATPYVWRDPSAIPPRPWVYGRWFLRGTVACVVAPGGSGKSTMLAGTALALASGRDLLGKRVWDGPKRVWLWNLEDDMDELSRSIQAAAIHHALMPADIEGRLFVDSGMEGAGLCTAVEDDGQFKLLEPIYTALTAEIERRGIDVLIVDPFVSSHEVEENANSKIDKIAKAWGRVAKASNCVIVLVHHTSKAGSGEVTAMSARGAVALINAARSTLVLNRMSDDQAQELGVAAEERSRYVSVADDKHNRAPAEKADWYELVGVDLGNGVDGHPGDSIAVVMPWALPDPFDDVTAQHLEQVKRVIDSGEWRENAQASDWAGHAVAQVLGLNADDKAAKGRIKSILRQWIANGALKIERRKDGSRHDRPFVVVGRREEE